MTATDWRRSARKVCALALTVFLGQPVAAWNSGGHRLTAMIGWERMDDDTREAVGEILRHHPDYERWLEQAKDDNRARVAFVEAATWPDDIRRDPRFYTEGTDDPTPTLPGFPDMKRRPQWHYVDRPLNPGNDDRPVAGELDRRLPELANKVADRTAPLADRAYALPWLIHLVGDAHQPLHVASRLDAEGKSDRGGNLVEIVNPFSTRFPSSDLHRYWDDLPAPPWLRHGRLDTVARQFLQTHADAAGNGGPSQWIEESRRLANDYAYPPAGVGVPVLSTDFHESALAIAQRRVTEAGIRLARLLRQLLQESAKRNGEADR